MQIICNFGLWNIGLIKKYVRSNFLFKLQNGAIIQNGADYYNFHSWTITFLFFNRFENQNMFLKDNFISYLFSHGVFQIFYAFLQALESLIVNY
jgi:hypothetical protein